MPGSATVAKVDQSHDTIAVATIEKVNRGENVAEKKAEREFVPKDPKQIVHPVYLDLPMVVSFVAALEGGVAYGDRRTMSSGSASSTSRGASAGLRIPLISTLFRLEMSGDLSRRQETELQEQVEVERQHTGASLFNLLRWNLCGGGLDLVKEVRSKDDVADLEPQDLVEMSGVVESDPVLQIYDALQEVMTSVDHLAEVSILSSLLGQGLDYLLAQAEGQEDMAWLVKALSRSAPDRPSQGESSRSGSGKRNPEPSRTQRQSSGSPGIAVEIIKQVRALVERLREDAKADPVTDFYLHNDPSGLRAVLTLSRKHLHEDGAPLMFGGEFTVIGKVTRVLAEENEQIELLRRTLFGYVPADKVETVYRFITEQRALNLRLPNLVVRGPAVQILPIAVFA